MARRDVLRLLGAGLASAALPQLALAASASGRTAVAGAWRGPRKEDTNFAGVLVADWEQRTVLIHHAVPLPSRPHGLLAEADGNLLVCAARPGAWLLRCDTAGKIVGQVSLADEGECRLAGHCLLSADGQLLYTSETDHASGHGRIGVRDRQTLKKIAEWDSHGIDPHQLLLDGQGNLVIANGGVPRTRDDKKIDLHRMESSLVRLDAANGQLLGQWRLADARLSLRHMAWNRQPSEAGALLGIAMQAEHNAPAERAAAPILAVFDGDRLSIPTRENDGVGYCGDIAPAHRGGFALSSHQPGLAHLWHPAIPDKLQAIVQLDNAYALSGWDGPGRGGGVLVATAVGMGRWHPEAAPDLLPWPQAMALDNHWIEYLTTHI